MSFAAPLWLLGALSLLVPLVLHLLARGRGRRVRVGSVRLLEASPPRRPRRLQLQRPLLLALRCLLLALVALALAAPRLRREAERAAAPRPWVLVDAAVAMRTGRAALEASSGAREGEREARETAGESGVVEDRLAAGAAAALPPAAREAIAGGAEVHLLAPGLPLANTVREVSALPDVAAIAGGTWSLLREAAATAPPGTRLLVVSSGRLAALRGERPAFANGVEWYELPDARANRWPARVLVASDGSKLLVGESDATRTSFAARPLSSPAAANTSPAGDAVAADDRAPLAPPRPVQVVVLAAPDRASDARYLHAALAAASEAAGVIVDLPSTGGSLPAAALAAIATDGAPRIVFWLGDTPPPPAVVFAARGGTVLIADGAGREETCLGSFAALATVAPVAVRRCVALSTSGRVASASSASSEEPTAALQVADSNDSGEAASTAVLWRTDTGRALLVAEPLGRGRWLRFASRFHPAWSDLVLSPALPEWLRDVLLDAAAAGATAELPASDRRSDAGQGRPARAAAQRRPDSQPPPPSRTPEHVAWLFLFPLLVAERWLAARR